MTSKNQALSDFKKNNKQRRELIAKKKGYASAEEYMNTLIGAVVEVKQTKKKKKPAKVNENLIIHVVDILDASGSMSGSKFSNATEGIRKGIDELLSETETNYTHSFIDFSGRFDIVNRWWKTHPRHVGTLPWTTRGSTALNQAVGQTLETLIRESGDGQKVLVNIYTDGGENDSKAEWTYQRVQSLIKEAEGKGITVTFVGLKNDVQTAINMYHVHESNTMTYDGSGAGLAVTMAATVNLRKKYATKAKRGEDVSRGFYKKVGKL